MNKCKKCHEKYVVIRDGEKIEDNILTNINKSDGMQRATTKNKIKKRCVKIASFFYSFLLF